MDFAYALANHRPQILLGKSVGQLAARIQMMSHHMSKPCEILPRSSDFHDTLLVPCLQYHFTTYSINCAQIKTNKQIKIIIMFYRGIWRLKNHLINNRRVPLESQ